MRTKNTAMWNGKVTASYSKHVYAKASKRKLRESTLGKQSSVSEKTSCEHWTHQRLSCSSVLEDPEILNGTAEMKSRITEDIFCMKSVK